MLDNEPDVRPIWQVEAMDHGHTPTFDSTITAGVVTYFTSEEEALKHSREARTRYSMVRISKLWEVIGPNTEEVVEKEGN